MIFKRGWFGPKLVGWGASPASWEGWAATGAFVVAMGLTGALLDEPWVWLGMAVSVVIYLAVVVLTYDKNARTSI